MSQIISVPRNFHSTRYSLYRRYKKPPKDSLNGSFDELELEESSLHPAGQIPGATKLHREQLHPPKPVLRSRIRADKRYNPLQTERPSRLANRRHYSPSR